MRQEIVRQTGPVGRHTVTAFDGSDRDRVLVSALIAHYADALNRQEDGKALPQLRIPAPAFYFLGDDGVRAPQQPETLGCHIAQNAHGEPGAGERLSDDELP